jgi:hypothetical protein
MSASYSPGMPGAKMDVVYVLPGVSTARATEWFQLGQKIVSTAHCRAVRGSARSPNMFPRNARALWDGQRRDAGRVTRAPTSWPPTLRARIPSSPRPAALPPPPTSSIPHASVLHPPLITAGPHRVQPDHRELGRARRVEVHRRGRWRHHAHLGWLYAPRPTPGSRSPGPKTVSHPKLGRLLSHRPWPRGAPNPHARGARERDPDADPSSALLLLSPSSFPPSQTPSR